MKRLIAVLSLALVLMPQIGWAEGNDGALPFQPDVGNIASVQRGARDFVNYCSGCHTLKYLRYSRMAANLHIPESLVEKDLMFVKGLKFRDEMVNAMPSEEATKWFGKAPPDLTLEAEYRGPRWIYNYLQGFYLDSKRPSGANNPLLPGVAMPDVLWSLQGLQKQVSGKHGNLHLQRITKGSMTTDQFRSFVGDITNFLAYAGMPEKLERDSIAPGVILFLAVLLVLTYLLKKEFWRDIH